MMIPYFDLSSNAQLHKQLEAQLTPGIFPAFCVPILWFQNTHSACKVGHVAGTLPLRNPAPEVSSTLCPGGGIGRRCGLKIHFAQASAGSSPAPGTNQTFTLTASTNARSLDLP